MSTTAWSHAVDRVTTGDVARLAGARAWPSISILLDTTWGDEMSELVVEEGFFFPVRVTANGVHPVEAAEVAGDADDFLHDVVDDLVETVIERGGWVAFTKDGALEQHGRIAQLLGAEPGSSG